MRAIAAVPKCLAAWALARAEGRLIRTACPWTLAS